ncbi:hypothetical protein [Spirosoma pollinicola]|uniref:XRE family transcriptional regulator n=1 Tax=Spirosoma pollinicola TaxID=2057025 RepID=A0A2K8YVX0_9BACT|nr:hypothetical protein [Spirosoma pollinicola]AUD01782.1 hypothetical protein CWM47_08080 [Spirosoma pollinicola]
MIPIDEKIKTIFAALDTTPHKFLTQHRFNRMTIYNIVGGRTKPGLEILERICVAEPRISAEYLLRGEGAPLKELVKVGSGTAVRPLRRQQAQPHSSLD